ncbi:membrane protein AbrB duplication [Hartmannibacter diazotrophicus]|uniref:Membrane protein AbrB duplication n=1 Tax=Hartmannibacter diazotrophicus TaxID=1482074 RepID=A0A2C9DDI7_9HYPH|nr:AbrB family transcriptional regulator [Hartmannibacter diazotrophicus]SON58313.1 membrane protein AbrB duplication [Hartmannibacter diazotrophicus]
MYAVLRIRRMRRLSGIFRTTRPRGRWRFHAPCSGSFIRNEGIMMGSDRPNAMWLALALSIGLSGGFLFSLLGMPAPWLSGSMIAVALAVLSGLKAEMHSRLRDAIFILLGISMGAGVTPEAIGHVALWPLSLAALFVTVAGIVCSTFVYLRRCAGWDKASALFGAVPGALSYVLMLAETTRADVPRVALSQTIRVFLLVAVLPGVVTYLESRYSDVATATATVAQPAPAQLADLLLMMVCGLAAGLAGMKAKVPAGALFGAFFMSAFLHGSGLVSGILPPILLTAGYVFLGTFMGLRFSGTRWSDLFNGLRSGLGAFVVGSVVSVTGALVASFGLDLPLGQALVAFAPGGLEAMVILAFSLGLDPAFVATHQLARFSVMMFVLPVVARWLLGPGWNQHGRSG